MTGVHPAVDERAAARERVARHRRLAGRARPLWFELAGAATVVAASTWVGWMLFGRQSLPDVALIDILGVVIVATQFRLSVALLAAGVSVLAYDFFFFPPYLSFLVYERRHVVTLVVMFVVAAVISTLTRQIRAHAEIERDAEAVRHEMETERLRSSVLSSVSHDLRTPLAVITGAASTLLSGSVDVDASARRDLLRAIYEESVRLTRLVNNLLDMSRLAAGAVRVAREWQSLEAVVGAAVSRVEERLRGRPLTVRVPADLPLVPFDAVLIEQVLINLLENAAKYSPFGAPIEVLVSTPTPREAVVEVADRGSGVPPNERERIFDKFYRVPGVPSGGAGLGLAICKGIVEVHGGRIEVVDREGGGSVFRFTLPIVGSPPAVEEDGAPT